MNGKPWTEFERAVLRSRYGREPAQLIAISLGRSMRAVYNEAYLIGLGRDRIPLGPAFDAFVQEHHALGWSDAEIAAAYSAPHPGRLPVDRHTVGVRRAGMGLPDNALSEHRRRRVAAKTAEQLAAAGLPSMAYLRINVFREFARDHGWPEDLRPRAVQILNAIWRQGPMTRREIATAIGMRTDYGGPHGGRKILASNDPEGSYLANLVARGLLVRMRRAGQVVGNGKGRSVDVYTLPVDIKRRKVAQSA